MRENKCDFTPLGVQEEDSHGHPSLHTLPGHGTPAQRIGLCQPAGHSHPDVISCLGGVLQPTHMSRMLLFSSETLYRHSP